MVVYIRNPKICQSDHSRVRITLAGFPAAITLGGIFDTTILFAPITVFSPICTPFRTRQFKPNHTFLSISIGAIRAFRFIILSVGSKACQSKSVIVVLAPQNTFSPSIMLCFTAITVLLKPQWLPTLSLAASE